MKSHGTQVEGTLNSFFSALISLSMCTHRHTDTQTHTHTHIFLETDMRLYLVSRLKRMPARWETGFDPWVGKIPWRRQGQPTPVFLPGESHGWRSLVGCSPWGHKESDTTEQLHFTCGSLQAQGSHFGRYLAVQQQGPTPPYSV